jgi:hypothetical protein
MLARMQSHGPEAKRAPVLRTVAKEPCAGIVELANEVEALRRRTDERTRGARRLVRIRRLVATVAAEALRAEIARSEHPALLSLCEAVARGELGFAEAAARARALAGAHKG